MKQTLNFVSYCYIVKLWGHGAIFSCYYNRNMFFSNRLKMFLCVTWSIFLLRNIFSSKNCCWKHETKSNRFDFVSCFQQQINMLQVIGRKNLRVAITCNTHSATIFVPANQIVLFLLTFSKKSKQTCRPKVKTPFQEKADR